MKNTSYIGVALLLTVIAGCTNQNPATHAALGLNEDAAIHELADLPENPLLLHSLTSRIQPQDGTLSTLYGNAIAYNHARTKGAGNYPAGAILYYVTWQAAADREWFGANVPERIKTVEQVRFTDEHNALYTQFTGNKRESEKSTSQSRIDLIKNMKIADFAE
ncbi:MAG: cytochrome P460 family protein [Sphingobacterium sp.]|jgi:hypothetical protein|uniref:cytochrome P460 family protein n=1 Tax=Sphingobacterium sp. TaxID=341027 RepID=UPI0028414C84|nr:cytochrome P460 family protein [Sphingobacterium sp.]MDR3007133.1 cytochrome P460 family protein [Sphingobacterium sp.]